MQINGISWASKLLALLKSRILTAPLTSCPLKTRDIFRKLFANQILPTSVESLFSLFYKQMLQLLSHFHWSIPIYLLSMSLSVSRGTLGIVRNSVGAGIVKPSFNKSIWGRASLGWGGPALLAAQGNECFCIFGSSRGLNGLCWPWRLQARD